MNAQATIFPTAAAPSDARAEGSAAIRVRHLTHRYRPARRRLAAPDRDRPALDDVSFDVRPGEVFGILGPNGGGKTTLFRILATLLRPRSGATTGEAFIFGHDVLRQPHAVRSLLGVVFQNPSLDPKLTAYENLLHQGHLYGLRGSELAQRIDHWLERFNLADRRDERVERFSGGLRRRVELAKALLHQPRLLMMDEPSTGLDVAARRQLWEEVLSLRDQQGLTVPFTTHLMDEAERCDRLAIVSRGRLIALDRPDRLKARIGGQVVTLEPNPDAEDNSPQQLARHIEQHWGPWPEGASPRVVGQEVRFEHADGTAVVAAIANRWPGRVRRFSVGQPTLEDVFLHLTGSAFQASEGDS